MPSNKDYSYRVRREVPVGSTVVFLEDAPNERYMADDVGTVMAYSNAGFQGILATVRMADGRVLHGVPAGILATTP